MFLLKRQRAQVHHSLAGTGKTLPWQGSGPATAESKQASTGVRGYGKVPSMYVRERTTALNTTAATYSVLVYLLFLERGL